MNWFRKFFGVSSEPKLPSNVSVVHVATNAAIVVTLPEGIDPDQSEVNEFRRRLRVKMEGTFLETSPIIVLLHGVQLTFVDQADGLKDGQP